MSKLVIEGLRVARGGEEILHGIDLSVESGCVEVIMGPNGSGKSTLAHAVMGHPKYEVLAGSVTLDGEDLLGLRTHERASKGLFHAMQYPTEVPGVPLEAVLREAGGTGDGDHGDLHSLVVEEARRVNLATDLLDRGVNVDYSGGEKKRAETVQLAVVRPRIAILDEIDSGLDVDALRDVSKRIEALTSEEGVGVLAVTHYARLLDELQADHIHVLMDGRIVKSGGPELARELEATGYEGLAEALGIELAAQSEADRAGQEAGRGVAMDVEGPMTEGGLDF